MTGFQSFVKIFKSGEFVTSKEIRKKYNFQKALVSLYVIPTFFRGIYYIPTIRERKGHFFEDPQSFLTRLFNLKYKKKWYWSLSTAARAYGIEWSATKILELTVKEKTKTIILTEKIETLKSKKSFRSKTLAKYLESLEVNLILIHQTKTFPKEIKINENIGPVSSKEQLAIDTRNYLPSIRNKAVKNTYKRILAILEKHIARL